MSFRRPVKALINRLGTPITLTNGGAVSYDPVTGATTEAGGTTATQNADITAASASKLNLEVQAGDLIAAIAAQDFTPDLNTIATLNGTDYKVIFVNEVYAFGELTLYEMQLRRIGNG